jgi:hypothetical protein
MVFAGLELTPAVIAGFADGSAAELYAPCSACSSLLGSSTAASIPLALLRRSSSAASTVRLSLTLGRCQKRKERDFGVVYLKARLCGRH